MEENIEKRNWPGEEKQGFYEWDRCMGGWNKREVKKRPSVETEGRLTIACHMKRDNDLNFGAALLYIFLHFHFSWRKATREIFKNKELEDYQIVKEITSIAKSFFQIHFFL